MTDQIRGYAEGYYGRLLNWAERLQILDSLAAHGMSTYYYAPKEDACHRWQWRRHYGAQWRADFRQFCQRAQDRQVAVVAGVAPGIDFDFSHLCDGADFQCLVEKCTQLLLDGASGISLLLDDIDADFEKRCGGIASEGLAHARLANELAFALRMRFDNEKLRSYQSRVSSLWVTPRIYADELAVEAPDYLGDFMTQLDPQHHVLYCGSDIVSRDLTGTYSQLVSTHPSHRIVVWDNLYANDYCPRRLFVGPWQGREGVADILLNPTGMVNTDCLLLDIMASAGTSEPMQDSHRRALERHAVPDTFLTLLPYFCHPVFNDAGPDRPRMPDESVYEALEYCLWRWKSDLSREWYPYLFGLKHDLLINENQMPATRIRKTQNAPLAARLLDNIADGY